MADITLISSTMPDLLPMTTRSSGPHVSTIITDLCISLNLYPNNRLDEDPNMSWMQLGSALEHAIIQRYSLHYPDRYIQPGELTLDGIHGTPDLFDLQPPPPIGDTFTVEEIKLAWMSSNHPPDSDKFWRYWVQIAAYCQMARTLTCHLHVCHVNGDYKQSGPVYNVWRRTFTRTELAENWAMLKSRSNLLPPQED